MDPSLLITILAGITVAGLIVGVNMLIGGGARTSKEMEERLSRALDPRKAIKSAKGAPGGLTKGGNPDDSPWRKFVPKRIDLGLLYEQADVNLDLGRFLLMIAVMAGLPWLVEGLLLYLNLPTAPPLLLPVLSVGLGASPFLWLLYRRRRRINQFTAGMPEALELTARALRAGHGLGSGLKMVADEMAGPVAQEFGRVFEEQNLGIPMEDALRNMAERVPSMDVRFFVTAVVIQRAAGGDLGEVLDKIGRLIRQRFEIRGQVAALTGEGRLSGAVLLAMPPGLLAYLFLTNPDYVMPLFTDPELGRPMLIGATIMQVLGALAIRKIVDIKV